MRVDAIRLATDGATIAIIDRADAGETIEKVKRIANPHLKVMGVVITLYDRRTNLARDVVERLGLIGFRVVWLGCGPGRSR